MVKKVVIIGNGAAGISAAEEICGKDKDVSITMITQEATVAYYRPMLSEYISENEVPKRFYLHDQAWYDENQIKLLCGTTIIRIDPKERIVQTGKGDRLAYDRLILATGSYNFIPPMEGPKKENILSLRTLEDADLIKKMVVDNKRIVILGGGLLGLELGWQLLKLGCDITVVEMMDRLLPKQLDIEASEIFEEKVKSTGIKILKGVQTKEIMGEERATAVALSNGEVLPCDLLFYSIGVRANTQLALEAGLKVNRGILVNEQMQTSEDFIFAAGDCAEYEGINYAIWPEAVAQGRIAGRNALGDQDEYETLTPFNLYSGMNMKLFSIGDVGTNPEKKYDFIQRGDEDHYEKYFFENEIFVGGILIGDIKKSTRLKNALKNKLSLSDFQKEE